MKNQLTVRRLLATVFIFACTAVAWFLLGGALSYRTGEGARELDQGVTGNRGPAMAQAHPVAWYVSPTGEKGRSYVRPKSSRIAVDLDYEPLRKGLFWYRGYKTGFHAQYEIPNPTPIAQTIYVSFKLPAKEASYTNFAFVLGDLDSSAQVPGDGVITQAVVVPPHGSVPLSVAYDIRGLDRWDYLLGDTDRVQDFELVMTTSFDEVNFPEGTGSPLERERSGDGWKFVWSYPDVIGAQSIGMDMPKALNAGPVAARISFFAPVSLLFFFAVLLIFGAVRGVNLHPMNYFFLAAGCFAFQLLFAYLVDLVALLPAFAISAAVSLVLVNGYLHAVGGRRITSISLPAQFAYMVLFSYSFFFDGLSGLTITLGAIATLALLMLTTAKVDWGEKFGARKAKPTPPPFPPEAGTVSQPKG